MDVHGISSCQTAQTLTLPLQKFSVSSCYPASMRHAIVRQIGALLVANAWQSSVHNKYQPLRLTEVFGGDFIPFLAHVLFLSQD